MNRTFTASDSSHYQSQQSSSARLKLRDAFGMASDFQRQPKYEADQYGGDIRDLMNYQYEKNYLVKAKENDAQF